MMPTDYRFVLSAAFCATAIVAQASPLEQAKAAMRERVPVVDKLKASGAVGESSAGLLAIRDGGAGAEAVVAAENADRSTLFAELAKRSGGSAEAVGRTFARQMAAASQPGVWIQREDGGWFKK